LKYVSIYRFSSSSSSVNLTRSGNIPNFIVLKWSSLLLKFSKTRNDSKVSSFMFKTRISSCIRSRWTILYLTQIFCWLYT
jgi:hypothetical protein